MATQEFGKVIIVDLFDRTKKTTYDTEEAYMKAVKDCPYMGELIGGQGQYIKPVFDIDAYEQIDIEKEIERLQPVFQGKKINYAKREPREHNGKMKYSYRVYVDGCRIRSEYMKELFNDTMKYLKVKLNANTDHYDGGIYDKNRILHTPYTTAKINKNKTIDVPMLTPVNCSAFDCCASYVLEDYDNGRDEMYDQLKAHSEHQARKAQQVEVVSENIITDEKAKDVDNSKVHYMLNQHIDKLSVKRSDAYDTWTRMLWCIINICMKSSISMTKCSALVHKFSKKSAKYDENEVDRFFDKNYSNPKEEGLSWKYMYECLKEDDPEYYEAIHTPTYGEYKRQFELTHCKILYPPMVLILTKDGVHDAVSMTSCKESYAHLQCMVNVKKNEWESKPFITKWLLDKNIRRYDKVVFKPPPSITKEHEFNTWVDFNITDEPSVRTERNFFQEYCDYLSNLVANKVVANFILARYASRLQKPAVRTNVCFILYGSEGDGKNMLLAPIYKILGKYGLALDDANKLYEKHATFEKEKLFILINEAGGTANFTNSEVLKSRITDTELWVNPKGMRAYSIDNMCDYDMTTNNQNVVKLTDTSCRRFFQAETTGYYRGKSDFFNDYDTNIVNNPVALKQIYDGLMSFDVSAVIPSGNFQIDKPETEISKEVKHQNRDKVLCFLEHLVINHGNTAKWKVSNKVLFDEWMSWLQSSNIKLDYSIMTFGIKLTTIMKNQINVHEIECIVRDRKNMTTTIYMEPLRSFFEKLNGFSYE